MERTLIAVPSVAPGGLDSQLGMHFGHCDLYTLVEVKDGQAVNVGTLPNVPHEQGGCMAPVNHLAQNGVTCLIAGGMGMRPLMGFNQVGITVYSGQGRNTVGEVIEAFLGGDLPAFTPEFTCGGGGGH
ncbi:MAG: dinitrogenase iron-molybdenum cofactor biosynthesis protein [Desulfovibrio sp.]|nr:MAG: dinitrogenase iron-molybdenum cofactor biosynthesis protein [Desulfovibrio sp.]